jgi:integrase
LWPAECRVRYTLPGGGRRWFNIGDPRTMDLPALRAAARAALAIADAGGDPATERAARLAAWDVRTMWQSYRSSLEFSRFTPEVQRSVSGFFNNHIIPRIGNEPLTSVDVPMAQRLMRAVESDTSSNRLRRRRGGPSAARKAARLLSTVLTWSVSEGRLDRNPLRGTMRITSERMRECVITTPEEYARLFSTMDAMQMAGRLRPVVRAFIIVAACTGARRSELRELRWGDVDLDERRATLRNTKGAKLARRGLRTEVLSLPLPAVTALVSIKSTEATPMDPVFSTGRRRGVLISVNRDWRRVRDAAGLPSGLVLHSLRHSLATVGTMSGMTAVELMSLLRHRAAAASARYIHLADRLQSRLQDRALANVLPSPGAAAPEVPTLRVSRTR